MKFTFIKENHAFYPAEKMCQCLKVSSSGYYSWLKRPPSKRNVKRTQILRGIRTIRLDKDKHCYGAPRLTEDLNDNGINCGKKQVASVMKNAGIAAKTKKKWKATTNSNHKLPIALDFVKQNFTASKPEDAADSINFFV